MTPRRILILLGFGGPAAVFMGIILWINFLGHGVGVPTLEDRSSSPVVTWTGPTRPPRQCPEFFGRGPELFELGIIEDRTTLDVREQEREVLQVGRQRISIREITFVSYEMQDCRPAKVRLHGLLAFPVAAEMNRSGRLAGVVRAHGLVPHDNRRDAVELAAALQAAVFSITGPGFMPSNGWDSRPQHFFDTATDARRSWLWAQTMAVMRGVTLLAARPEVDPERLGVLGYSSGGMAALDAAGTDPRVRATVAWSAAGFLDLSARATPVPGWHVALLEGMDPPRTADSKEWQAFLRTLDPSNFLNSVTSPVLLINGAQDQYYPIHTTAKTFDTLNAHSSGHAMYIIAGYDHGPIADRVIERLRPVIMSDVVYWFAHHLHTDDSFRETVPVPEVMKISEAQCCPPEGCRVCSSVDIELPRSTHYQVAEIELQLSTDSARTFIGRPAKHTTGLSYVVNVEHLSPEALDEAVYFVEVVYRPPGQVRRVRVSSRPHVPAGFIPRIWPDARKH